MIRGPRVPADRVAAMYADYCSPLSLSAVGRKYGRHAKSVRELFTHRGFALRPSCNAGKRRTVRGSFAPAAAFTPAQIEAMIAAATKIAIPDALRTEWRIWPLARRAEFVARLRDRLASPYDAPRTPCSAGVEPFAYGSPRAHAIMADLNAGRDSRRFRVKIDLCSQGVIWRERLFFWAAEGEPGVGAYYTGPWTKEEGRPALHRLIWAEAHGRRPGPDDIIVHVDGNKNNFAPANLGLRTRNDLARINQAAGLTRRSRELTGLLLHRNQSHTNPHDSPDTLSHLSSRKARSA